MGKDVGMRYFAVAVLLMMAVLPRLVSADEVYFKNGDRLTGKIEKLLDGKMVLKSEMAGDVTIDLSNIQTFSSDEPIEVHLSDGTVLKQKIVKAEPGKFAIEGDQTLTAQAFELSVICSINPPETPEPRWQGDISAGYTSTHGNTKTELVTGSINLRKRTERDRTLFSADYARGEQEDPDTGEETKTEDWWRTRAKYDYFFKEKLYGYVDGRYEKDSIAELDRRVIVGGGLGYQWVESDLMNFSTEAGLASRYEKYENETESKSEISAQLGYHFDRKLAKSVKFINDLTYYPSLEQFSDYFLTTTGEIRAHFTESMFTNFKVIFNHDATPAEGQGSTDTKYILGVGASF
jgi:putative salt-induced outer membrane protein YdiY